MIQLREQSQYEYIDETLPLASAAFTSLAWQAVGSKPGSQLFLVVGGAIFCGMYFNMILVDIAADCRGFDGKPNPQYLSGHWNIWTSRVPNFLGFGYMSVSTVYLAWIRGHHGRILRHGGQIPSCFFSAWYVVSAIVCLVINPQTKDAIERTCWISPNKTVLEMASELQSHSFSRLAFGSFWLALVTLSCCGKIGFFTCFGLAIILCFVVAALGIGIGHAGYWLGSCLVIFIAYLILGRQHLMHTTSKGIKKDSIAYVRAFEPFLGSTDVERLAVQVKAIKEAAPKNVEKHHKNIKVNPGDILQIKNRAGWVSVWSDRIDLFSAAFDINSAFQQRAADWAASGQGKHHWAPVKGVFRVYQKVKRAYGGRIHRVCDIVRTTITFDDLSGVRSTLKAIEEDKEVDILRVKNRFDRDYMSEDCYRDLALLVVGPATGGFVCEVQLNLQVMYAAKSEGGHTRYKLMRDARGD